MHLGLGTLLKNGEYKIEKILGQGGFGITYQAEQISLGRKVALKEFFMSDLCNRDSGSSNVSVGSVGSRKLVERFRQKFIKEARMIATLSNAHIISIYDIFEENGTAYYAMEYLEGKSLAAVVNEKGALLEADAVKYIYQVADALAEIHSHNLLHLDVKPANIMLNNKGEAVLIDFGISKHYDENGVQTSSALIGTSEGFAPIEQYEAGALANFTPATDVYALGATLFFLITGQRPPKAGDVMNDGLPVLLEGFSTQIRNAVELAMRPRRKDRPQNVEEFLGNLTAIHSNDNPEVTMLDDSINKYDVKDSVKSCVVDVEKKNRNGRKVILVVLLLLACGISAVYYYFGNNDARVTPVGSNVAKKSVTDGDSQRDLPDVKDNSIYDEVLNPDYVPIINEYGKWGFVDRNCKEVIPCKYDAVEVFIEGMARVKSDGKIGFIDAEGNQIVKCQYGYASAFSNGLAVVCDGDRKTDGRYGFVDRTGKEVIKCQYEKAYPFQEGVALVQNGGKWGLIDMKGNALVDFVYDEACDFSEGMASVKRYGVWGYIDKTGENVISCQFDEANDFSEGMAVVKNDYGYYFIDTTGKNAIGHEYDYAYCFSSGMALVRNNDKDFFIDKTGKKKTYEYYHVGFFHEGLAVVETEEDKYGFIDKDGNEIVSCKYDYAEPFSEGMAIVESDGKYGFVNTEGDEVVECIYDAANDFSEGLARVNLDGKEFFIDKDGKTYIK